MDLESLESYLFQLLTRDNLFLIFLLIILIASIGPLGWLFAKAEQIRNGNQKNQEYIAAAAMFFAGLILLIPHRIGMSRVNYVIKRYNLPISRAGLLLYKYHNNIELSLLHGTLPGVVTVCVTAKVANFIPHNKSYIRWLMIIFLFFMLISSIIMFIIYISGGDFGHLNAFYFSLIFLTLFDGFANAFAFAINPKYSSLLSAGIPLSGLLISMLHYVYKFFSDLYHWDDFDYYVLRLQLICNIITILIAFLLWSSDVMINHNDTNVTNKLSENSLIDLFTPQNSGASAHIYDWFPICMLAFSLGTVYAFYPSIAPYSIIDFQYASVIELWILIISALTPLGMAILDLIPVIAENINIAFGPSGYIWKGRIHSNWIFTNLQSNDVTAGDKNAYHSFANTTKAYYGSLWFCAWICAIPYILCIQIFMSLLHYPQSLLSSFFNKPFRIQFISILFNTLREVMQACGFAGAGKQLNFGHNTTYPNTAGSDDYVKVNGTIAATNKLITLFVMMFCVFTGDGYLQHYRRCCRDCWPTTGYTKYQSFFYWLRFGFKGGIKSITSSFTDLYYHNLRPQFISYA